MTISPFNLVGSKIFVVREIRPNGAQSTNQDLAQKGLAIGNNLDNIQNIQEDDEMYLFGKSVSQYRTPYGKWPVYIVNDLEEVKNRFLSKEDKEGAVIYVAEIDLNKLTLGTNIPFLGDEGGLPATLLRIVKENDKFYLLANDRLDKMGKELRLKFDESGRLKEKRGEFFLDNFTDPSQLEDEFIYRFQDGQYKNITADVKELRNEVSRELIRGERRL